MKKKNRILRTFVNIYPCLLYVLLIPMPLTQAKDQGYNMEDQSMSGGVTVKVPNSYGRQRSDKMDKRSSLRMGEEHSSELLFLDVMQKIKQGVKVTILMKNDKIKQTLKAKGRLTFLKTKNFGLQQFFRDLGAYVGGL